MPPNSGIELAPYPDGTWWPNEHQLSSRFPLMCRGNVGEVYPNVVSPLTGSLVSRSFARGQLRLALEAGMASTRQMEGFDGSLHALASLHAGYLFVNVSATRSAAARTPGMTVEMIDSQMFGLSGAPPHQRTKGERNPWLAIKAMAFMGPRVMRAEGDRLEATRASVRGYLGSMVDPSSASDTALVDQLRRVGDLGEPLMYELLRSSTFAGVGRTILERVIGAECNDDLLNRLTSGLGTIESAVPAQDLWRLGRLVAQSASLSEAFDGGLDGLLSRLTALDDADSRRFDEDLSAFLRTHGSRGPEEWELAAPSWGLDPSIVLASLDRLRFAPPERDPVVLGARLTADRASLTTATRASLPRHKRGLFDRAIRTTAVYAALREGSKAAFVRVLDVARRSAWELATRAGLPPAELCLLTVDELPGALADLASVRELIDERRARREYLAARVPPFWFYGEMPQPSTWELRSARGQPDSTQRTLTGLGVCSGTATGRARVVLDPSTPGDLGPDEILVAPLTDPAWTPLFLAVAGVVVDVGAHQSHAAIVARELGIPAVVSVAGASCTIPDGTLITVDGSSGVVHVHGTE